MSSTDKTAAFNIPILPQEAAQPQGFKLPLFKHQLRALHRCLLIEMDGSLTGDFGDFYKYKSRGGGLADQVGTGKTATSIGLALSGDPGNGGDTLVVAPEHLIPQWKEEIIKFAGDTIDVVVGKLEFEAKGMNDPPSNHKRRIVLVDVNTILNEEKVWYNFRCVYASKEGHRLKDGEVKIKKIDTKEQRADIMTKGLPTLEFETKRAMIMGW